MKLRDYQQRAVANVGRCLAEHGSTLLVLPTGCGKTVCFAAAIAEHSQGKRAIVLAHRFELIEQNARTIGAVLGEPCDIERGDLRADLPGSFGKARVVVASKDSLHPKRLARFDPSEFGLIVTDEAHHATAGSYRRVYEHFAGVPHLGVTATPDRLDRAALGQVFDSVAMTYEISDAINDGWLVPVKAHTVYVSTLDLGKVGTVGADLNQGELAEQLERERVMHEVAASITRECGDRRALVFTVSVKQAERLAEILCDYRADCARFVCGETPEIERTELFSRHKAGKYQFLVNVGVACLDDQTEILTDEGWVGIDEIAHKHRVANWEQGKVWFAEPLAIEIRDRRADERMVVLETKNRSIRVTDNHRMLYRTYQGGKYHVARAHQLVAKKCDLPISGHCAPLDVHPVQENQPISPRRLSANSYNVRRVNGVSFEESMVIAATRTKRRASLRFANPGELSELECEFIGFWLGDGSKTKLSSGGVEYLFWQAQSYTHLVGWIDDLISKLNYDVRRRIKKPRLEGGSPVIQWSLCRGTGFGSQERKGVYRIEPYLMKSGSSLLWGLNSAQFKALLRGFWMADGDHGNAASPVSDRWRICNTNRQLLDLLQAIACCRGLRANITDGKTNTDEGFKPLWKLSISDREDHRMTKFRLRFEQEWKPERVWCVKSESGFIITRRRGTVTVMGNTEGYDDPGVSLIVMARPTKSRALFAQCLGRGTRALPGVVDGLDFAPLRRSSIAASGKSDTMILDFTGNCGKHKLVSPADVLGGKYPDEDIATVAKEIANGHAVDVGRALERAREKRVAEDKPARTAYDAARARIVATAKYLLEPADLFDGSFTPGRERAWERGAAPTETQIANLERHGFKREDIARMNKHECARLWGEIVMRVRNGLCTVKQARLLERRGVKDAARLTFAEASARLDAIFGGVRA